MSSQKGLSFSSKIKKEVIINAKKEQENYHFLKGVIFSNAYLEDDWYTLNIKNDYIKGKIISKLDKSNIKYVTKDEWKYKVLVDKNAFNFDDDLDYKEYLTFFFSGVFVGSGSISNKESTSYHLEISTLSEEKSQLIKEKLNSYEFNFHILKKQKRHILYIKKVDELLDFLSAIGAKKAWFELQNLKIHRDKDNVLNRINNIDFSNLQKIADSSVKHIENINYVFEHDLTSLFSEDQLMLFRLKIENPWLSLNELVLMQNNESDNLVSKSGVNHWLRKLDKIVKNHKEK
ncbi:DNA-binding protein WhiA [Mycoplasmopsis edwardii]|nr:DNA-binding protein WhiA [Mycoplasmopsis edwardii]